MTNASDVECLQPREAHAVIRGLGLARRLVGDGLGDRADVIGRAAAAAADDVDETGLRPILDVMRHLVRGHVVAAHLVRQSGVGMKGGMELGDPRHVLDVRSQQIRPERAVEADRQRLDMAEAVVEGLDRLTREGAP